MPKAGGSTAQAQEQRKLKSYVRIALVRVAPMKMPSSEASDTVTGSRRPGRYSPVSAHVRMAPSHRMPGGGRR